MIRQMKKNEEACLVLHQRSPPLPAQKEHCLIRLECLVHGLAHYTIATYMCLIVPNANITRLVTCKKSCINNRNSKRRKESYIKATPISRHYSPWLCCMDVGGQPPSRGKMLLQVLTRLDRVWVDRHNHTGIPGIGWIRVNRHER